MCRRRHHEVLSRRTGFRLRPDDFPRKTCSREIARSIYKQAWNSFSPIVWLPETACRRSNRRCASKRLMSHWLWSFIWIYRMSFASGSPGRWGSMHIKKRKNCFKRNTTCLYISTPVVKSQVICLYCCAFCFKNAVKCLHLSTCFVKSYMICLYCQACCFKYGIYCLYCWTCCFKYQVCCFKNRASFSLSASPHFAFAFLLRTVRLTGA